MITSLGASWTIADLTGNSQFIYTSSYIYIVTNSLNDGTFKLLRSEDLGASFQAVAFGTLTSGSTQFDPVIAFNTSSGVLHIVGSCTIDGSENLLKFRHNIADDNTVNPVELIPITILEGRKIHSGYDMVVQWDGKVRVAVSVTDSTGHALICLKLSSTDIVTARELLTEVSDIRTGAVYGGISMLCFDILDEDGITPIGSTVEVYYTAHQKRVTFGSVLQEIRVTWLSTQDPWWRPEVTLDSLYSSYADDSLTVMRVGNYRVLCQLYYTQVRGRVFSTLRLGSVDSTGTGDWHWADYAGTTTQSYTSPMFSLDEFNSLRLAFLIGDINANQSDKMLRVADLNLDTLQFTLRNGNLNRAYFRWIRGSKSPVTVDAKWAIVGERSILTGGAITEYAPFYASELNLPPVVTIVPSSSIIQREVTFTLDASAVRDPDSDILGYTWYISDPTGLAELRTVLGHPERIDVWVPKAIGPGEQEVLVTVEVQDYTLAGTPINSPVSATSTLTVPVNAPPQIVWTQNPIAVTRNSSIVIAPTITDDELDSLTYSWEQTGGQDLEILSGLNLSYLVIKTHGVMVLGDSVYFTITVSDGINLPVSSTVQINIASINTYGLDDKFLSRSLYHNTHDVSSIVSRNNKDALSVWAAPVIGAISTNFFKTRISNNVNSGYQRMAYISPRSVVMWGSEAEPYYYYRKVFLPNNDMGTIVDALQTETDDVLVLTDTYRLLRYSGQVLGPEENTSDYWQNALEISPYLGTGIVKWFVVSKSTNGNRILAFVTSGGLLLIQINELNFTLMGELLLTSDGGNLYGGDDVLFVRLLGVESLHKGKVLIGSVTSTGSAEYFETIYDLGKRAVTNAWDRLNRINREVYTGELFDPLVTEYSGNLQAPVLSITTLDSTTANLTWEQVRTDLTGGYVVYVETSSGIPGTIAMAPPIIDVFKVMGGSGSVNYGSTITLKWSVSGADTLMLSNEPYPEEGEALYELDEEYPEHNDYIPVSSTSQSVTITSFTTYTLTATNSWGSTSKSIDVTVLAALPTISSFTFTAPTVISPGDPVTLNWSVEGADTIAINQGVGPVSMGVSSKTVYPLASAEYTLYATNESGTAQTTISITV